MTGASLVPSDAGAGDPAPDAGFSLIELLVAFAILATALAVLLPLMGNNTDRTLRLRGDAETVLMAKSLLDRAGADLLVRDGLRLEGESDDGRFVWRLDQERVDDGGISGPWRAHAVRVTATVHAADREESAVSLVTLRIGEASE